MKQLKPGIHPVLMTPLKADGALDLECYRYSVKRVMDGGVHGVVVLGSMGELPYLSPDERNAAIETVAEACGGKIQVIAGATAFGTDEAVKNAKAAAARGADALLVPLPVYFHLSFREILDYYKRIAGESGAPVLYYHIPSTTHLDLTGPEIAKIFEIENVQGIKESIMDLLTIKKHMQVFPKDIIVFSGSSFLLKPVMELGGRGVICPVPNIVPEAAVEVYDACLAHDSRRAAAAEKKIFATAPLFFDLPLPAEALMPVIKTTSVTGIAMKSGPPAHAKVKEALRLLGHPISPTVKSPLPQLTEKQARKVARTLKHAGLI